MQKEAVRSETVVEPESPAEGTATDTERSAQDDFETTEPVHSEGLAQTGASEKVHEEVAKVEVAEVEVAEVFSSAEAVPIELEADEVESESGKQVVQAEEVEVSAPLSEEIVQVGNYNILEPVCQDVPAEVRSPDEEPAQLESAHAPELCGDGSEDATVSVDEEQVLTSEVVETDALDEGSLGERSDVFTEDLPNTSAYLRMELQEAAEEEFASCVAELTPIKEEAMKILGASEAFIQSEAALQETAEEQEDTLVDPQEPAEKQQDSIETYQETAEDLDDTLEAPEDFADEQENPEVPLSQEEKEEFADSPAAKETSLSNEESEPADRTLEIESETNEGMLDSSSNQAHMPEQVSNGDYSSGPPSFCSGSAEENSLLKEDKSTEDPSFGVLKKVASLLSVTDELLAETASQLAANEEPTSGEAGAEPAVTNKVKNLLTMTDELLERESAVQSTSEGDVA